MSLKMKNFYYLANDSYTKILGVNWNRDGPSLEITRDDGFLAIIYKLENSPIFSESIRAIAKEEREIITFFIETNPGIFREFKFNKELDSVCEFIHEARLKFIEEAEEISMMDLSF